MFIFYFFPSSPLSKVPLKNCSDKKKYQSCSKPLGYNKWFDNLSSDN